MNLGDVFRVASGINVQDIEKQALEAKQTQADMKKVLDELLVETRGLHETLKKVLVVMENLWN